MVNGSEATVTVISTAIPENKMYWEQIERYDNKKIYSEGRFVIATVNGVDGVYRSMKDRNTDSPDLRISWKVIMSTLGPKDEQGDYSLITYWNGNLGFDENEVARCLVATVGTTIMTVKLFKCVLRTYVINNLPTRKLAGGQLEVSKHYALKYLHPWDDYDVVNVKINAITDSESSGLFSKDSIYSEFFDPYDVGLADYIKTISAVPDMYVCECVDEMDPIKYGTVVVIPKAILDLDNIEELLFCDKFTISIGPVVAYNEMAFERGEYLNRFHKHLRSKIREVIEIGDAPVDISISPADVLKRESEYDDLEEARLSNARLLDRATTSAAAQRMEELHAIQTSMYRLEREVLDNKEQMRMLLQLIKRFNILTTTLTNSFRAFELAWIALFSKIQTGREIEPADTDPIGTFITRVKGNEAFSIVTADQLELFINNTTRSYMCENNLGNIVKDLQRDYDYLLTHEITNTNDQETIDNRIGDDIRKLIHLLIVSQNTLTMGNSSEYSKSVDDKGDVSGIGP